MYIDANSSFQPTPTSTVPQLNAILERATTEFNRLGDELSILAEEALELAPGYNFHIQDDFLRHHTEMLSQCLEESAKLVSRLSERFSDCFDRQDLERIALHLR